MTNVFLVSLQVTAGFTPEVSQAKSVFLRNHQDQVLAVLAVAMWLPWKDTFQRIEGWLDLWIIYWERIERRCSSVICDTPAVINLYGTAGIWEEVKWWKGSRVLWSVWGDWGNLALLKSQVVGADRILGLVWGCDPPRVQTLNSTCGKAAACRGQAGIYCWSTSVSHKSDTCFQPWPIPECPWVSQSMPPYCL